MKIFYNRIYILLVLFVFTGLCSCNDSKTSKTEVPLTAVDTLSISDEITNLAPAGISSFEEDTITAIKFKELIVNINGLVIYDKDNKISQVQSDSVNLYAELGETIEGQAISIETDELTNIKIEQCYETSVTIMNEGPHCDLIEWKHFNSDWKTLKQTGNGLFICEKYNEADSEKFPEVSMSELRQKVKEECGDSWFELVKYTKSPTEYPCAVSISRYFIRISAKRKDNGQITTKSITIETPMGC